MSNIKKLCKAEVFAAGLLSIVIICLFFIPPSVGVADNGDFERIMTSTGLEYADEASKNYFFDYSQPVLTMKNIFLWGRGSYATTQVIPIRAARIINRIFYSQDYFHMLSLAVVYALCLLTAIYYIVKNIKTKNKFINILIVLICIWVLGDATNIVYFNSLYGEAFSFVTLLLMLGLGLEMIRAGYQKRHIVLFFIAAGLFFGSKLQYTLLSPLLFLVALPLLKKENIKRIVTIMLTVVILISCMIYIVAPTQLGKDTKYNSVFYGVLRNSPDVEQDLKDLGLPAYMAPLAGTNAYDEIKEIDVKGEQFEKDFYKEISRADVILFYLTHFDRLFEKMEITADFAYNNRIGMMGNYKIEDAKEPHQINEMFTSYNDFKARIYPNSFWFIFIYYLVYIVYLVVAAYKTKNENERVLYLLLLIIMLVGALQFPLPIIGNGEADISKQLFIFNLTFDISLFVGINMAIKRIMKKYS